MPTAPLRGAVPPITPSDTHAPARLRTPARPARSLVFST